MSVVFFIETYNRRNTTDLRHRISINNIRWNDAMKVWHPNNTKKLLGLSYNFIYLFIYRKAT